MLACYVHSTRDDDFLLKDISILGQALMDKERRHAWILMLIDGYGCGVWMDEGRLHRSDPSNGFNILFATTLLLCTTAWPLCCIVSLLSGKGLALHGGYMSICVCV